MKKRRIYKTERKPPPPPKPEPPPPPVMPSQIPKFLSIPGQSQVQALTSKQRAAVAGLLRHGADTKLAAQAAGVSTYQIDKTFKLPAVQQYLTEQLDRAGATDAKIAQRIAEGLDAVTQRESFDKTGRLLKGTERPDYTERREAARLALRLKGLEEKPEDDGGGVTNQSIYNIVINAREARGLDAQRVQDVTPEPQAEAPKTAETPKNEEKPE